MGHRMEVYVPAEIADEIIDVAESFSIETQIVGFDESSSEKKHTIIPRKKRYSFLI